MQNKELKIYRIDFGPVYPVGCGLIVAAYNVVEAAKIAKETIEHTDKLNQITVITPTEPGVLFYQSGDY